VEGKHMVNIKTVSQEKPEPIQKGAPVPTMQKPASVPVVPTSPASAPASSPASGQDGVPTK
jgi:hypothetical protein